MTRRIYGNGAVIARGKVAKAVRDGLLAHPKTLLCVDCCGPATGYDHRDYNHPLRVDPICHSCNAKRGPAIPRKGFFAEMFETEVGVYTKRITMKLILKQIGIEAEIWRLPDNVTIEHWLPFKDALLEWEAKQAV